MADGAATYKDMLELERGLLEGGEPASEGKAPPEGAEPKVEVEPAKPPVVEEPPKVEEPPEEPPKPPVEAKPPEEVSKPLTAEEIKQHRQTAVDAIASRFTFSEEDQQALISEPHKVLSKLAAEVQVGTYEMVLGALSTILPNLVRVSQGATEGERKSEGKFYERWPELQRGQHHAVVSEVAVGYRRAFPKASVEEAIEDIGPLVLRRLGLKSRSGAPPPEETPKPPERKPFRPAGVGAAAPPAKPTGQSSEAKFWADFVKDL